MSLIHALIARGTTVLAEHSQGSELKPGTHKTSPQDGNELICSGTDYYPLKDPAQQFEADLQASLSMLE
jgi:hypothetical protein